MSIRYARETAFGADEYIAVLEQTTMRDKRPLANRARIRRMLDGSGFVVVARDAEGVAIGLARCITDEAWICYCAELAVIERYQGHGIGRSLLDTCRALLGPDLGLILVAEPEAAGFYSRIGMEPYPAFFSPRINAE